MNHEDELKLQAYLDGELPESESRELAGRLARDPGATALLTELRQTREAMTGFEAGLKLPESRDFYWSKIQRQVQAQAAPRSQGAGFPFARLRRFLLPLTGVALAVVAALVATRELRPAPAAVETSLADSGAMVYHDYSAGATFVWLSYPADKEIADNDDLDTFGP